jgi:hypothetical protein
MKRRKLQQENQPDAAGLEMKTKMFVAASLPAGREKSNVFS